MLKSLRVDIYLYDMMYVWKWEVGQTLQSYIVLVQGMSAFLLCNAYLMYQCVLQCMDESYTRIPELIYLQLTSEIFVHKAHIKHSTSRKSRT